MTTSIETATLGGGCFWCIEAVFERIRGVRDLRSGYAGGHVPNPTYEQVCGKKTGHVEVVQVDFDPAQLSFRAVLEIFFSAHDPTTMDRQGNDVGPQYRSAIFTHSDAQAVVVREVIDDFVSDDTFGAPIVTEVRPLDRYWHGEAYHQRYFRQHATQPYCAFVIAPKVAKIRKRYADRLLDAPIP
jgi:peptide-methionine (S)-S-oxide reductase